MSLRFPFDASPPPGEAYEVAPGVLWVRLPLPMTLDHVNIYALDEGDGWTLIDAGIHTPECVALWEALLAGPLAGKPVTRVMLTHHHPDHVGMAGWFMARGAQLWSTPVAYLTARMLVLDEQPTPPAETVAFWRLGGMDADLLRTRQTERPFNFADCVVPLPLGFQALREGDTVRMGGRNWIVRIGQGHAPDHATFWSLDDNLVIGGDQILPGISPNVSVYPTEPEADPLRGWIESCARFASLAHEDQLLLGGHKLPFQGLPQRLRQLEDNHHSALERLHAHIATPKRASECFAPLFKRKVGPGVYGMALGEAYAHLAHLYQTGRATRQLTEDGAYLWQAV